MKFFLKKILKPLKFMGGSKKVIATLVIVTSLFSFVATPQPANAALLQVFDQALTKVVNFFRGENKASIEKVDASVEKEGAAEGGRDEAKDKKDDAKDELRNVVFVALKQSLDQFLQTMAFDVATWLASGGEGQQPLFETQGWGEYLTDLADSAGGTFVESLGGNWLDFNVCNPSSPSLKISIGLGLAERHRPSQPNCKFTDIINNFENLADGNFFDNVDVVFDPNQNDIGIAFQIFGDYHQETLSELIAGKEGRQEGEGFKGILSPISDVIKTPASLVKARAQDISSEAAQAEWQKVEYGDIALDAIGTFVSTLAGELFQKIFKEGLADGSSPDRNNFNFNFGSLIDPTDLYFGDSGSGSSGRTAAELRFSEFLKTATSQQKAYDILSQLSFCGDPENPGPEECIIKPDVRLAIERGLTVRQAIEGGYLDGGAPFGFMDYDSNAIYRGIPYRSIVALRVHRIVPVGWELAAQAADKFEPGRVVTLNQLMADFDNADSLYYKLVDPDWVLVAPDHLCRAEGFGPKLIFEENLGGVDGNGDGDFNDSVDTPPERFVGRSEYCADFETCLEKNADGSCRYYGYCNEERRIWNLDGSVCPDFYDTCQSYQARNGEFVNYLNNTLEYNGCSIDNVGCQWFCQDYNYIDDVWTCLDQDERVLKECVSEFGCELSANCVVEEGGNTCSDQTSLVNLNISGTCTPGSKWWDGEKCLVSSSCTIPQGGVACEITGCEASTNFVINGGFEQGGAPDPSVAPSQVVAENWIGNSSYFERVSGQSEKIFSGSSSIRFFSAGGNVSEGIITKNAYTLPVGEYTFSGNIFNSLNSGEIKFFVIGDVSGSTLNKASVVKNKWDQVSFDFSVIGDGEVQVIVYVQGAQVSGSAWIDNIRISESCITDPVTLTLVGSADQNESKIHLDRDAQSCDAGNDGCTEFIRTRANLGTNLVRNSSFETWPDPNTVPPGWEVGEEGQNDIFTRITDSPIDNFSMKITNIGAPPKRREFSTNAIVGMKPNTAYRVSFWARADVEILASENLWYAEIISDHNPDHFCSLDPNLNCFSDDDEICSNAGKGVCLPDWTQLSYFDTDGQKKTNLHLTQQWRRFVFEAVTTRPFARDFKINIAHNGADELKSIYIDGMQVEEVALNNPIASAYSNYGQSNVVHLQKAPDYLNCTGDVTNDPDECLNYALYCQPEEVGCEAYTPIKGGPSIPGVVAVTDYCPQECVGYQAYKQSPTFFADREELEYFIPNTANSCSASQVGCTEFTNLDEVAAGGEGREYYRALRLCELPDEPGVSCQNFFAWQGSDDTGYQLKVYNLSAAANAPKEAIEDVNRWPDIWCGEKNDLNGDGLPDCCDASDDVLANPFCQELLDISGNVTYRISANTISCSQECHPLRMTDLGLVNPEVDCASSSGTWQDGACIYKAIPSQSLACSDAASGCREYKGNSGANTFTSIYENFEDGDSAGWRRGTISSEALSVGGHSLKSATVVVGTNGYGLVESTWAALGENGAVCSDLLPDCDEATKFDCYVPEEAKCVAVDPVTQDVCRVELGETHCSLMNSLLDEGQSYLITFWAKADTGNLNDLTVRWQSSSGVREIGKVNLNSEWRYYTFGPIEYSGVGQGNDSRLVITSPSSALSQVRNFYIDNIQVKEISDHVYVIKDSWNTPVSCDTNPYVTPAISSPQYMLGCEQYRDSYARIHNLKSFDSLCSESAVGCEALIDTQNSSTPFAQTFNADDAIGRIDISEDKVVYLTNRSEFRCSENSKGCQLVGNPTVDADGNVLSYENSYVINNPDLYSSILCGSDEVGCEEFSSGNGFSYFKDPRGKVCEYRQVPGSIEYDWFKRGSTSAVPDCPQVYSPIGIPHPTDNYVGQCEAEFSSCTAYIDPVNEIGKNIILNSDFTVNVDNDAYPDGWDSVTGNNFLEQEFLVQGGTAYTLSLTLESPRNVSQYIEFRVSGCDEMVSYDSSMVFNGSYWLLPRESYADDSRQIEGLSLSPFKPRTYSGRFYAPQDDSCALRIQAVNTAGVSIPAGASNWRDAIVDSIVSEVSIRETGVYFALSDTVDNKSCNGLIDPSRGCVMFNDRSEVNYSIGEDDNSYLIFDADSSSRSTNGGLPVANCPGNCDSNAILKVSPDRVCESWLYCDTYTATTDTDGVERRFCASIGQCDSLNDDGTCNRNVQSNQNPDDYYKFREEIENLSGYSQAGLEFNKGICISGPPSALGQPCTVDAECNAGIPGSCDKIIQGYFPYAQMTQRGSSAKVANSSFERTFGDTSEPIGWSTPKRPAGICKAGLNTGQLCNTDLNCDADPNVGECTTQGVVPIEWYDYKFRVEKDIKNAISGAGYLRLNAFYEAVSESIDVEGGNEYILSGKINTFYLEFPNFNQPPAQRAEILIQGRDSLGNVIPIQGCQPVGQSILVEPWYRCGQLRVGPGVSWTELSHSFVFDSVISTVQIKLSNYVEETPQNAAKAAGCLGASRYLINDSCELGGYSLFDDISLKPVLEVNSEDVQSNYVARSCRLYPTADALACEFARDDSFYFGKYGYCVTVDPNNPSQCMQWWPVDQIAGETLDEIVAGYNDRIPLYYCTDRRKTVIDLAEGGLAASITPEASDFLGGAAGDFIDVDGQRTDFVPFSIDDAYLPLFRYPYIDRFTLSYITFAVTNTFQIAFQIPTTSMLNFNTNTGRWEDFCAMIVGIPLADNFYVGFPVRVPDFGGKTGYEQCTSGLINLIFTAVSAFVPDIADAGIPVPGALIGVKVITDQNNGTYDGAVDPISDIDGDILGLAYWVKGTTDVNVGAYVNIDGDLDVNYCNELVQVVTSAGTNKAYANRVSPGSGYVLEESSVPWILGGTANVKYTYYNPFNYADFIEAILAGEIYVSSDYQPFGGLVQPDNSQYPSGWNSREGVDKFPLFYEPPRTDAFDAPYQARMGELHRASALQQIFAKAYEVWHWVFRNPSKPDQGGQYRPGPADGSSTNTWDIPTEICPTGSRPASPFCKVLPFIDTAKVKVNDSDSYTLKGTDVVKLDFNVQVDSDQLPLVKYVVEWGDGKASDVSGVTLRNRVNEDNPFSLFHLYDFWELVRASNFTTNQPDNLDCFDDNGDSVIDRCVTKPRIKAIDNWSAVTCKSGVTGAACNNESNQWIELPGTIEVFRP